MLSERVESTGHVIGIERDRDSVATARRFVADRGLKNVDVIQGDATATARPTALFEFVHARLVLVNVPWVEAIVREMVRLVRPGGVVTSYESDYLPHLCDAPLQAWDRLFEMFQRYASSNGIDLFVGRRTHPSFVKPGLWISK